MLTKEEEDVASGKPIAKARPRQKPAVTLTSISIPVLERTWTDNGTQRSNDQNCFEVSKAITRLLRHDKSVPRGIDGAVHNNDIIEECRRKKVDDASQWLLGDWISKLEKGGGAKNIFQYCVNPKLPQSIPVPSSKSRTFRRKCCWSCVARQYTDSERIYRVSPPRRECKWDAFNNQEWFDSWRTKSQTRKTIRVLHCSKPDPMEEDTRMEETPCDLTKPRIAPWRILGNLFENTVNWCNLKLAQDMQSFSTTHCQPFALRKWYAWKRRRISVTRYAKLQDCHGLYSKRIRTAVNKINKTQEHLVSNLENRRVPGRPCST